MSETITDMTEQSASTVVTNKQATEIENIVTNPDE